MMTHMCIDATVRAACDHGFECIVAADACTTRDLTFAGATVPAAMVQRAFLAALNGTYAQVITTGKIVTMVQQPALGNADVHSLGAEGEHECQ